MSSDNGIYILKTPTESGMCIFQFKALLRKLDEVGEALIGMKFHPATVIMVDPIRRDIALKMSELTDDSPKWEWRVKECMAIGNLTYKDETGDPEMMVALFGTVPVFFSEIEALQEAQRLFTEIMSSDWPLLEYGISTIQLNKMFPI